MKDSRTRGPMTAGAEGQGQGVGVAMEGGIRVRVGI